MKAAELQKQLAEAQATVRSLEQELAQTNRGLVALTMELEQRVDERTAELRAAHAEQSRTNSDLLQLKLELEDRVNERTAKLRQAIEELQSQITERKRLEEALRSSEERFRIAAETANDLIYEWDLKQSVQWLGKIDEMLGYETGEFPRMLDGWAAEVHPEDMERTMAAIHAHLERRAPYAVEYRVRRKDGVYRWWSARGAAARTPDGKPARWVGSITDITERKQAEETLRESEARYRTLVENIPQKIFMKDRNHRWVSVNENLARDFGIRPEEIVGKMNSDLFSKELADKYTADDMRIIETGQTQELEERYMQAGRETWVHTTKTPVRNKNGEIIGIFGIFWDITERKRAEEALRQSREEFKELFDSAPIGYHELDAQGRLTRVNQTELKMLGYQAEELLGQFVWIISADPEASRQAVLSKLNGVPPPEKFERTFRRKDGSTIPVQVRDQLVKGEDGAVISIRTVFQDITERKRAEEEINQLNTELEQRVIERTAQLEAANKELEAFSYSVSHDLRAPLRAVDGFSQVVLEDYGPQLPEGCRQDLQTIRNGAQKMGKLIDDLLMFSRLSRLPLSKQTVDTGKLVRGVLEELISQREGRRIEIQIGDLPPCQADPALLKQVWVNLLSNALKYTGKRESALVEIGCAMEKGRNVHFVRDNGTGFDMKYAHKLFGVFQRLHRAEDYEGTGVGLAIVQRVIHRHGGRVWAQSALDSGATFYFTLEGETKL